MKENNPIILNEIASGIKKIKLFSHESLNFPLSDLYDSNLSPIRNPCRIELNQ
jgi:hypothetical protein